MNQQVNKITFSGIMIALAYVTLFFIRIPIIPSASFLRLDIKEFFILIPGLLYGPFYAFTGAVIVSFLQMLSVSDYGVIGLVMNILSVTAYTLPISFIYQKIHNKVGLIVGLFAGCVFVTGMMLVWNYLISPLYMGISRKVISTMLIPVFLPFNLIKSGVNSIMVCFYYCIRNNIFIPNK